MDLEREEGIGRCHDRVGIVDLSPEGLSYQRIGCSISAKSVKKNEMI